MPFWNIHKDNNEPPTTTSVGLDYEVAAKLMSEIYVELAFNTAEFIQETAKLLADPETDFDYFVEKWNERVQWLDMLGSIHTQRVKETL